MPELTIYDVNDALECVRGPMTFYSDLAQSIADEASKDLLPKTATTSHEAVALD